MTYEIEIAVDLHEAEQFRDWLNAQGHKAHIGRTTHTTLVGYTGEDEDEIVGNLWLAYCNA